ncbi:MAG TPA: UDP-2,3-diacylglucosamine diphosphatase [Usitatibacter sp.]|nr:UDP-2,3-diacylglucosamine diphosphatase [Usitatibacter sp.]
MRRLRRTLFISDLHLDPSRPAIVAQLERFLSEVVPGADALYILGDLFEYWVGDDGLALPFPRRIAQRLHAASAHAPIHFMHGNRDFLAAERFARETGAALMHDPTMVDLYGTRAILLHGDTLCTDDVGYQAFRKQVRDPAWQQATLALPIEDRLVLANRMRTQSEGTKQATEMEIMDVSPDAVARAFSECGCDLMIHGHTHRPGRHVHRVGGRERVRWVLPDWYERGGYLEATEAGLRALDRI